MSSSASPLAHGTQSDHAHTLTSRPTQPLWVTRPLPRTVLAAPAAPAPPARPFVVTPLAALPAGASASGSPTLARSTGGILVALLGVFVVLNLGDLASTYLGLHSGMHEGNPLMSTLLNHYGFGMLIAYKALVILAVGGGVQVLRRLHSSLAQVTLWICNALVFAVVLLNLLQYMLLR